MMRWHKSHRNTQELLAEICTTISSGPETSVVILLKFDLASLHVIGSMQRIIINTQIFDELFENVREYHAM
jgi:hypothetical protein